MPTYRDILYLRAGEAYQFAGDLSRAVASFRRARQLSPKSLEAAARLGYALEVAGQYKEAIANYREALAINPNIPVIMNNLAYLLAEQGGNLDEALRLTQTALRRMPQQKDISDTLGWITLRKNDTDAALQVFRSLVRKYPDEPLYRYHLAMALFQKGDRNGAKIEANMALERKPAASDETKIRTLLARVQ